ncbi:helix-turn-helix domain-containing protein [Planococcus liqunii]|uniref:helix-turn-helix domain-containing protein n=1 Tax=Planococcus liqunii TaxID=3058394 RepID=UPI00261D2081|nr:helix-turn-helix domain-containing protein [Planococcus sp. N056]WKA52661.1 helix-turn-helix domain-containing protein [Planococcus sp. N056]
MEQKSLSYIASKLKRSKSTIYYELKHCQPYNTFTAQLDYVSKRDNCGCRRPINQEDVDYILSKLKLGWSLEILGTNTGNCIKLFPVIVLNIYGFAILGLF